MENDKTYQEAANASSYTDMIRCNGSFPNPDAEADHAEEQKDSMDVNDGSKTAESTDSQAANPASHTSAASHEFFAIGAWTDGKSH